MTTLTYSIPEEPRFHSIKREAEHYLGPLGFIPSSEAGSKLHVSIRTGTETGEEFFIKRSQGSGNRQGLEIEAPNAIGAAHGFHHALKLLGFGFSFFADAIPEVISLTWPYPGDTLEVRPKFKVRGLLPWHNFLNSPTVWNSLDYERYLLTLWRWGSNTALFHQYDNEPLAAVPAGNGKWKFGKPMQTSKDAPWGGKQGLSTTDFAHGTGDYFQTAKEGAWGANHCFSADSIDAAQSEFSKACAFARSIGINMAFGFELTGDPTIPAIREIVRERISHVLTTYPDLRTLCLWQAESRSVRGWPQFSVCSGYESLHRKFASHFSHFANVPMRQAEAVRVAEWFTYACQVVQEIKPSIQLVFSGWGGDKWMRWGDFWTGLDKILPAEVILAQLDNIDPYAQDTVSRAGMEIAECRDLWSIPWIESDGGPLGRSSMWHPQDDAARMTLLAQSAYQLKYTGILGIHWQTAGVELNANCLISAGWSICETASDFRHSYARCFFSAENKTVYKVGEMLRELEELGPGWTGTNQQGECSRFSWEPFSHVSASGELPKDLLILWEQMEQARDAMFETPTGSSQICRNFDGLLYNFQQNRKSPDTFLDLCRLRQEFASFQLKSPHARRLQATMDFVIAYEKIRRELAPDGRLRMLQESIQEIHGLGFEAPPELASEYRKRIEQIEASWKEVFTAQSNRLDTGGDLGNLANLNLKAYEAWREFRTTEL